MILWVMYDIENNRARSTIAKYCKQAGLYRVQLSVFLGSVSKNQKDTLELQIEPLVNKLKDKVYLFPMRKEDLNNSSLMGQAFDKKLITDEVKALFF